MLTKKRCAIAPAIKWYRITALGTGVLVETNTRGGGNTRLTYIPVDRGHVTHSNNIVTTLFIENH